MQVFLPDLMEVLQDGNEDLKMKALVVVGSRFSLLGTRGVKRKDRLV